MTPEIRACVETLWAYHHMGHALERADVVFVLCSHDTAVAERAADVMKEGWAPLLAVSGGLGSITRTLWQEPEADQFARIARARGVRADAILIENQSTNTGENVAFTRRLLESRGLNPQRFILVQKPYMERRAYATFRKLWPEKDVIVTSPQVTLDEYLARYSNASLSVDHVISIMVGDLQRIAEYPKRGFQIAQDIPANVWAAFESLVRAGYTRHLVPGT